MGGSREFFYLVKNKKDDSLLHNPILEGSTSPTKMEELAEERAIKAGVSKSLASLMYRS